MNENPTVEVNKLQPITKFIYTLGVLPTSYLMSMTFQEQVTWLCNYLSQTVIPAINNDVEAVQELQWLYKDLQDYINDYFDNLDVQEEINNKLEEMAQSGEITDLIKSYIDPLYQAYESEINTTVNAQNSTISSINTNVNTLSARVDSITHLTEGSTTGDAELIDGRVSFDSLTYSDIGDNIRTSDLKINNRLGNYVNTNIVQDMIFEDGMIDHSGDLDDSVTGYKATMNIPVAPNEVYFYKKARRISYYNDSTFVSEVDILSLYATDLTYTVPANVNNCRITFNKTQETFMCKVADDLTSKGKSLVKDTIGKIVNMFYGLTPTTGYFTNGVAHPEGTSYAYYREIKVLANHTYTVYPRVRFVSYYSGETTHTLSSNFDISGSASAGPQSFTPEITGYVYVSVYKDDYDAGLCQMVDTTSNETVYPVNGRVVEDTYCFNNNTIKYIGDQLQKPILNGLKLYNFGDSIGAGDGNSGVGYAELLHNMYGVTATDYAVGGSTISYVVGQSMQSIQNHITNASSSQPDIILIEGGANDYTQYREMGTVTDEFDFDNTKFDTETYIGGLEMCFSKLTTKYPGVPIIWIYTHRENTRTEKSNESVTVNFTTMHDRSIEACNKWSIPVVDLYNESGLNTMLDYYRTNYTYNNDGTHPNQDGYVKYYLPFIRHKIIEILNK